MLDSPCELNISVRGSDSALQTANKHALDNTLLSTFAPRIASCEDRSDLYNTIIVETFTDYLFFRTFARLSPPLERLAEVAQALAVSIQLNYTNTATKVCGWTHISRTGEIADHRFDLSDCTESENALRKVWDANPTLQAEFEYETLCMLIGVWRD